MSSRTQMDEPDGRAAARVGVYSFIVKIWLVRDSRLQWHGVVTQVPSGERRRVGSLPELSFGMMSFLESLGVSFSPWLRAKRAIFRKVHRRRLKAGWEDGAEAYDKPSRDLCHK